MMEENNIVILTLVVFLAIVGLLSFIYLDNKIDKLKSYIEMIDKFQRLKR